MVGCSLEPGAGADGWWGAGRGDRSVHFSQAVSGLASQGLPQAHKLWSGRSGEGGRGGALGGIQSSSSAAPFSTSTARIPVPQPCPPPDYPGLSLLPASEPPGSGGFNPFGSHVGPPVHPSQARSPSKPHSRSTPLWDLAQGHSSFGR